MTQLPPVINRIGYGAFVAFAVYHILVHRDYATAGSNLGIALIFDPFGPVTWAERPRWQQSILIVQVFATISLIAYGWFVD
jgi:hypothetical protein